MELKWYYFKKGMVVDINNLGEIRKNNKGTDMEIIKYVSCNNIDVKFLDTYGYVKHNTTYSNFKKGQIRNPYDATICDVGFIGEGNYVTRIGDKHTVQYQIWQLMLRRCYDPKFVNLQPSYNGICEVCNEWFNFQNFAKWWDDNIYQVGTERMHVDKDILHPGNKIYSPENCMIVPQRINMLFMNKPNKYGLPCGVKPNGNQYEANYNREYLGKFDTIEEAEIQHNKAKKLAIVNVANEYKKVIPNKLYEAMINWNE